MSLANMSSSSGGGASNDGGADSDVEEERDVAPGLNVWRDTTEKARSVSQLTLCMLQLSNSVSWEKSIMKVVSTVKTLKFQSPY